MTSRTSAAIAELERRRQRGEASPAAAKPSPLQQLADAYAKQGRTPPQRPPSPAERVAEQELRRWGSLGQPPRKQPGRP